VSGLTPPTGRFTNSSGQPTSPGIASVRVNTASVCARGTPNKLRRLIKANGWVRLSAFVNWESARIR